MQPELSISPETLLADRTCVRFLAGVRVRVLAQLGAVLERALAVRARKRPEVEMYPLDVPPQIGCRRRNENKKIEQSEGIFYCSNY